MAQQKGKCEMYDENTDPLPREVAEVISAVRVFTDTVARVGAEEFAEVAGRLRVAELAWVLDRLDDVRQDVAGVLEELAEPMQQRGIDDREWGEMLGDLESAGDGLYAAMQAIDPDADRHWLLNLYPLDPQASERR